MTERVSLSVAVNGTVQEEEDGIESLLVLMMPIHGEPNLLFAGDASRLREIAVEGLLNWPMYIPFADDQKAEIALLLDTTPMRSVEDIGLGVTQHALAASYAEAFATDAFNAGDVRITVTESGQTATLEGVAYLLFGTLPDGIVGIGRHGAGSEKQFLMEYAIGVLWGKETADAVQEILERDTPPELRVIARALRRKMIGLPPGEIHMFEEDQEEG